MLRYGFFDSEIVGYDDENMPIFDRAESSDFLAMFISSIISDGVFAQPGDCFRVIASEGMNLKIRPGFGIVKGRFAMDTQESDITIPIAPSAYKRIDRVVLRANYLERFCEIVVKEGVPDAKPVPPELLQPESGDYYELCLATVTVNAKQSVITQSSITDTRYDSRVCGVVTQVIDHLDTSVFFAQLDAFYKEFVEKSDKSYEEFKRMAQTLYQKFNSDITEYINTLKLDSKSAYDSLLSFFDELSASGQQKYNDFKTRIEEYILALKDKGNTDLAEITQQLLDFRNTNEADFIEWFEGIKDLFATDPAGALQNQIDASVSRIEDVEEMLITGTVVARMETEDGDYLTDDTGHPLLVDWPICQCRVN
ncbi:MAG: hypothetical protein HDR09_12900 [Lachnospiraceae bacterium]|nr:hypothetical protein [Lachnospiraceae bacterium]